MLLDVLKKANTNTTSTVSLRRTRSEKQQKIKGLKEQLRLLEASSFSPTAEANWGRGLEAHNS